MQEDAVLPVILFLDVPIHAHDEARDDGVGQRLDIIVLKLQRFRLVPWDVQFVVVQMARDQVMAGLVGELEAQFEMPHHVNQPAVRVCRVMVFGIGQASQDFAHVFQMELPLIFDQLR